MTGWKTLIVCITFMVATSVQAEKQSAAPSMAWQDWPEVGEATLTWGWWTIYQSSLRAPSARYQAQSPHALVITYARDISDDRLMKATNDQWAHLGFSDAQRARWQTDLKEAWGDIAEGDRLAFVRHNDKGVFHYQPEGQDWRTTLVVDETELADAFLAIWLSENTDYPDHRRALLGDKS
ncbi:chalcone isomerase family protein [Salinivibrio sp. ES.052]|uniref:chalcone isomerase family protein n=1 Tax=Salinivibrio sp. ES.052 TaxID=1882823 RepID=UPI0009271865|nr:chalcone isomerase family protein [Salinivibrio sp. ES.052]SIO38937.1 Chalcone isomerase-like [Salinivibrio sp. ES.052]